MVPVFFPDFVRWSGRGGGCLSLNISERKLPMSLRYLLIPLPNRKEKRKKFFCLEEVKASPVA
jgi:hypothetical protein